MKRILIAYASYGSGHESMAKLIASYLKENDNNNEYEIKLLDTLNYATKSTQESLKVFDYIYNHRMEKIFSFLYRSMDYELVNREYKHFFKKHIYNEQIAKEFIDFKPDIVLSTHFYGSNIASYLKKKKLLKTKLLTIVTDYTVHRIWLSSYDKDENFVVASPQVKEMMKKKKCRSKKIYDFGLPYNDKKLYEMDDKESIYEKYNLDKNKKIILFMGGGSNGSEVYYKYLHDFMKNNQNMQVVFVCGRNEKLKEKANKLAKNSSLLKVVGFVDNMYELYSICDMVISKSGGATVTECVEMQKYMLVLPGIGGQEKYNANFISKNRYGKYVGNRLAFRCFVKKLVKDPEIIKTNFNPNKNKNESLYKIKKLIEKI